MADRKLKSIIGPPGPPGPTGPQGPPGIPGSSASAYEHTQSSSSSVWTVNHNLGFRPGVTLRSAGGVEFEGLVTHTSDNQLIINLTSPATGVARLI